MIKVDRELFKQILFLGTDKGFANVYVNKDTSKVYSLYIREYKGTIFNLVEDEDTNEIYALQANDTYQTTEEFKELADFIENDTCSGLKDIIAILKSC